MSEDVFAAIFTEDRGEDIFRHRLDDLHLYNLEKKTSFYEKKSNMNANKDKK